MKVVIIEDREQIRKLLIAMINSHSELELLGWADTVEKGVELLQTANPDLVLLDIELPDGTSFDILKKIPEHNFKIIFVTTHDSFAIEAFKYNAIDYILKPVDTETFFNSVNKAVTAFKKDNQEVQIQTLLNNINFPHQKSQKIILNTSDSMSVIEIKNIVRCEAEDSYTHFFLNDRKKVMVAKSLKNYEELLHEHSFVRTHKSHLINLNHLDSFDKKSNSVLLSDGCSVPVSVRKKEAFVSKMKAFYSSPA